MLVVFVAFIGVIVFLKKEHRSGFPVDVWEATRFNVNINGKKVDKAVITQYFTKSSNSEIFLGYTLVSTTVAIYKLDSSKKTYSLVDGITRDYMNFEKAGAEDDLHDIFPLKGCKYLTSDKRITLGFKLQIQGDYSADKLARRDIYQLKQSFMGSAILSKNVSPLRIDNIEYNFNDGQVEIEVTFLNAPNLKYIFNSKRMSVSSDTFKVMSRITASSELECLDRISKSVDGVIVVIFRPSDSYCGYLQDYGYLKEDAKVGQPCSVYQFPLRNLHRIGQEIPLDKIHSTFSQDIGKGFYLISEDAYIPVKPYKLIDVIDKTKNQVASDFLNRIRGEEKIHKDDQVTKDVPDVKTLADCYRTCHDSEQLACNIFSFCVNGDTVECRVSSLTNDDMAIDGKLETAKNCSVYSLRVLNDYSEVPRRKFKSLTSIPTEHDLYACAEYCHASPDCLSFQFCDNSCSFGGFYTDSATEYDEGCSVYFPEVSRKYGKTGNKIVSEVIITEMNVNLEQCASLCHRWSDGQTGCKSFNYCPKSKTESSCSLTKFSVKNADAKTIDGGECSNYEMKEESKDKKNKESNSSKVIKGTSGSGAFGIILLFLFVGGLFGFVAPFAYKKVKHMRVNSEANENFTWSKQVDEST